MIGLLFLALGYILYYMSVIAANAYARLIRTGFDLYRFELLSKFRLELPDNLDDEMDQWRAISQFLISAKDLGEVNFSYLHPKGSDQKDNPEAEQTVQK